MSIATCPMCQTRQLDDPAERLMQLCGVCAYAVGVVPMPPPRRPPQGCRRCESRVFVRCIPREHSVFQTAGKQPWEKSSPMFVTAPPVKIGGPGAGQTEVDTKHGYGLLEMYICRGCGAVEWYCHDVESIPIHPHLMTDVVSYDDAASPYR